VAPERQSACAGYVTHRPRRSAFTTGIVQPKICLLAADLQRIVNGIGEIIAASLQNAR